MLPRVKVFLAVAGVLLATAVPLGARPSPALAAGPITYTYSIATKGNVRSDVNLFAAHAQRTYDDGRGWGLGGSIRFVRVPSGGSFTLWLAQAVQVPTFGYPCSATYSCHVGRNVIVNDDRWAFGSPSLRMGLDDYRHMVVNHETGHWLGFPHSTCPGPGQLANVMQQQSKGGSFLGSCLPNPWPRPEERNRLAARLGVVATPAPFGNVDGVAPAQNGILVTGWALDPDTTAPIDVRVTVNGVLAVAGSASGSRPDVGAAFGKGANHGFSLLVPTGGGTVCVDAVNFGGGPNAQLSCRVVPATAPPFGSVDGVAPAQNGVSITGWALDPDTSAPIDVHVYVNGMLAAAAPASGSRPDVEAAFGKGANHGFSLLVPTTGGTVCVYAANFGGGPNAQLACRVVPATAAPLGNVDGVGPAQNGISVTGWALDPDTSAPIDVRVTVNGVPAAAGSASGSRPDIAAAFGKGANHGFSLLVPTGGGNVCVYAASYGAGPDTQLLCRMIPATAAPFGNLDGVAPAPGGVTVTGWALDPDTSAPIDVHVYVNGVVAAAGSASGSRPDVGAAFGKGADHGFSLLVPAVSGRICVYAVNYGGGPNTQLPCRSV